MLAECVILTVLLDYRILCESYNNVQMCAQSCKYFVHAYYLKKNSVCGENIPIIGNLKCCNLNECMKDFNIEM